MKKLSLSTWNCLCQITSKTTYLGFLVPRFSHTKKRELEQQLELKLAKRLTHLQQNNVTFVNDHPEGESVEEGREAGAFPALFVSRREGQQPCA